MTGGIEVQHEVRDGICVVRKSKRIVRALKAAVADVEVRKSPADIGGTEKWDLIALSVDGLDPTERRAALERFADHNSRLRLIVYAADYTSDGLALPWRGRA